MKSITKRIISTLAICGALVLEAGAVAFGSLGKHSVSRVDAADTKTLTFDLSKNPGGWPTTNSTTTTDYTYTLSGTDYTFKLKNIKCNSGYLMATSTAALGLPAIKDYKLTKVVAKNTGGCSTAVKVGISSSDSSASYISGGEVQTWATQGSSYTYTLSGTANNTVYFMYVTNKNAQITELALTYEGGSDPTPPTTDYTVSFDLQGHGTAINPQTISAGGKVTRPTDPSEAGWTFGGWYKEQGCTTAYDFNTAVNSEFTLYAKWTQDSPTPAGGSYKKVTSSSGLVNGQYLIVCEDQNICLKDAQDAAGNVASVSISNLEISSTKALTSCEFTFDSSKGSFLGTNNKYFGRSSNSNGMETSDNALTNTVSITDSGDANIVGTGGAYLRCNPNNGNQWFRYYKSSSYTGQKAIQLYKYESGSTATVVSIEVKTAPDKTSYSAGENFDPSGLVITATYDKVAPEDIAYDGNESKFTFDPSTNLAQGTTKVQITYGGKSCDQAITVGAAVTLTSIQSITGSLTATIGGSWNTSNLVVNGLMSDGSTKVITSDCNITVNTAVPSSAGTGNASVTATYKTDGSKTITVTNIPYTVSAEHGTTSSDPLSISEAKAKIDSGISAADKNKTYYILGYYYSTASAFDPNYNNISYWVTNSSSGSSKEFEFFRIDCTQDPGYGSGDAIIVCCKGEKLQKFNSTYEVNTGEFYFAPYDVTFNGNGADASWENPTVSETFMSNYVLPATNPTKTGYNFAGWFTSPTDGTEITTESIAPKTSVGTLYAQWSIKTYTINYDKGQYGTGENQTDTKIYDVTLIIKGNSVFKRTGYAQIGWATEDGGDVVYGFGASYTKNESITLYPVWTVQKFTVMYQPGEGVTGEDYFDSKQYDVPLTLRGETYYKEGHTQTGWATEDGGEKVYDLEGTYTNNTASFFFPFWTADTYTVTYAPGAYGAEEQSTATKTYGVDLKLPGAIFTRSGYKQTGWALTDGGEKAYDLEGTYSANAGTTLYPVWSEIPKHSVTYLANGATGDVPTQENVAEGSTFTIAGATSLTKQDYHFVGWNDGTSTYQPEETYTMGNGNVTLTAQWELDTVKYSVGYSLTGVTVPGDAPTEVEEGDNLVVAVTPNKHYKIESMGVTMGGETVDYDYTDGVLTVENVTGNIVVSVSAAEKWYGATTQSSQNVTFGSIDPHLYHNEPFDVDVTANTGYHIVDEYSSVAMWKEGEGNIDIVGAYSNGHIHVDHVTGNLVLQIIAVKDTFSVSATLNDSVVAEGSELPGTVEYGDDLNVTFEPKTGYQINSITYKVGDAAEQTVTGSTLSIENITANVSLTVNTQKIVYSVTATYGDSTNSNITTSIEYGDSYSGKITPNDGKKFASVSMTMGGNPVTVAEDGSYSIASVTGNIVINVVTTDITYSVTATGSNYTNSNTATLVLWHGAYEATITPDDGYFIEDIVVTMGGEQVTVSKAEHGASASINIASVTGDISIDVTSTEIEMTGIVSAATKEADYEFGYDFDESDVAVVASFNDGTTGSVDATSVEGYDITKSGSQTVTVKVGEFEKDITVVVCPSTVVQSIEASTTKTEIEYGGTLTPDDITVIATYTDGHPGSIDCDSITGFSGTTVGQQNVTVNAGGKQDVIQVTVKPSEVIDHIEASTSKTNVPLGGSFTKEDVSVTYVYTDGHSLPGQAAESISGFNPEQVGEQVITVTAAGKTTEITITVSNHVLSSLEVTGYNEFVDQGKEYVFNGSVKAHYDDGTVEDVTANAVVSKVDTSGHGPTKATVTYEGVTAEITINVIQTKTPVEPYQAVAIASGAVIGVAAIAAGIFFLLKKFKI